jgi:hypothetical protein
MSTTQAVQAVDRATVVLRVLVAVALGVSAYLHFDLAEGPLAGDGKITLAGMFIGQAIVAAIVAIWVLARGDRIALIAALLVGGASFLALILSVYVEVPSIGPFPTLYEPLWYTEKVIAAVSAGVATVLAALALMRLRQR